MCTNRGELRPRVTMILRECVRSNNVIIIDTYHPITKRIFYLFSFERAKIYVRCEKKNKKIM